jgi:hypothetical protein
MAEPREVSAEEFAAALFGPKEPVEDDVAAPEPAAAQRDDPQASTGAAAADSEDVTGNADSDEVLDPLVAHLKSQQARRDALTQHLLAHGEVPQPTGEGALAHARNKREQQRDLVERLHGTGEKLPAVRPMPPISNGPRYLPEGPEPSGEPRPPEFRPEGADE